ncbi:MAG: peptidylprolyl isomerase [Bacteroidota bacterium]
MKKSMYYREVRPTMFSLFTIITALTLLGTAVPTQNDTAVIASFAGRTITLQEFRLAYLDAMKDPAVFDSPERRKEFLDEMIAARLLASEAVKQGLAKDELTSNRINAYRRKVLRDEHFTSVIKPKVRTEEKDVEEAYQFTQEQRRVSHLFFTRSTAADSAYDRLMHGASFDSIAAVIFTDSALASTGGDLGWVEWDQMDYDLAMTAFRLLPDVFSRPIHSQYGYHILKVTDFKKHPMITRQQYAERRRKTKYLLENKIGDTYALEYITRMLASASIRLKPEVMQFVDGKLSRQFTRKPKPADQMSPLQLRDSEVKLIETSMWDARNDVMAEINGQPMTVADFIGFMQYIPYAVTYSGFRKTFDYAVRDFLIAHEAEALGLEQKNIVRVRTELYKEFLLQNALRSILVRDVTVSSKEIRSYYDRNKNSYPNMNFEQARPFLTETVLNTKRQKAVPSFVARMLAGRPITRRMEIINSYYNAVSAKEIRPATADSN